MALSEAAVIVADFESKQVAPQKKLGAPASLDEATAILKSDRLDAFPEAVAFLNTQTTPEAAALKAQITLAWGEAELTVAQVLAETADALDDNVRAQQMRELVGAEQEQLQAAQARVALYRETDQALRLLAAEHVAAGAAGAAAFIAAHPDDYLGYRIAADAHRLRNEWKEFQAALDKVEEHNPDSNGLVFLRGVAAQLRDGNASEASKLYRTAVEKDPQFIRAQAQLVLVQTNVFDQKRELDKLREMAPDHQIVRWAGPGILEAYAGALERQQALSSAASAHGPGAAASPANP